MVEGHQLEKQEEEGGEGYFLAPLYIANTPTPPQGIIEKGSLCNLTVSVHLATISAVATF